MDDAEEEPILEVDEMSREATMMYKEAQDGGK